MSRKCITALRELYAWAASTERDSVPTRVLVKAGMIAADNVACAIAAGSDPAVALLHAGLPTLGESSLWMAEECSIDRRHAARINTIRSNWAQLDEGHRNVMCHAGLYTVAPALAEAQAEGRSLHDALIAIILGYEVTCRTALALRFVDPVPHPHAAWSAYGATATLAALRCFEPQQWELALGAAAGAAMAAPFNFARAGHEVINLSAGFGVALGFDCSDAARAGYGADAEGVLDVYSGVFGGQLHVESLLEGLGQSWMIEDNYHKWHACARQAHAAVEALLALRAQAVEAGLQLDSIKTMHLMVTPGAFQLDNPKPASALAARFSLIHIAASVWLYGNSGVSAFDATSLCDSALIALRQHIRLECAFDSPQNARSAMVEVLFEGGMVLSERCDQVPGDPECPFTVADVVRKCEMLAGNSMAPLLSALLSQDGKLMEPIRNFVGETYPK